MTYRPITLEERRARARDRAYAEHEPPDWIDETLLRPGQVAALFQVSRRTISDWARAGRLSAIITPGGHRRFRATEVRALIATLHVPAAREPLHGTLTPPRG